MQKSGRKPKLTKQLCDNTIPHDDKKPVIIKTEPEDNVTSGSGCYLCGVSSGIELFTLFEEGFKLADSSTVDQIKICIGREISAESDPNARICYTCLQKLNEHHSFWKQALRCNNISINQMMDEHYKEDRPISKIQACRFCLQMDDELYDLFSEDGASNERQLKNIRECLSVQINSWDPATKVCGSCFIQIQNFVDFRETLLPTSTKKGQHVDHIAFKSDGTMLGKKERRMQKQAKQNAIYLQLVKLLAADVKGRNFDVILENNEQLKVTYDGYQFRFHGMNEHGNSLWYCKEAKMQKCYVKLEIDSKGAIATISSKVKQHAHPVSPSKIMECPLGKGFLTAGDSEPFWLFPSPQKWNTQTRNIIIAGCRYYLCYCKNMKPISVWLCAKRAKQKCRAVLEIEGIFHNYHIKGGHNHDVMEQKQIDEILKSYDMDFESTEAISIFQTNNPLLQRAKSKFEITKTIKKQKRNAIKSVLKEKNPDIFKTLQLPDLDRNFACENAGIKVKIKKDGYEYRYFGTQEDKSTLWKCIYDDLHNCEIIAKLCKDGKQFETYQGPNHNHTSEPAPVFGYPLGQRMIGNEPLWLIKRASLYYDCRYVIYQDNIYVLRCINKNGIVRWPCWRTNSCKTVLIVKGDFDEICFHKNHNHEKIPEKVLKKFLQGRTKLLHPDKNLTFKQKLLSFSSMTAKIWDEVRDKYETFYILNKVKHLDKISHGFIFRGFKYSFHSTDRNGKSRWMCIKHDICLVAATVEGIFESIYVKDEHTHEMMLDSEIEHEIQTSSNNLSEGLEGTSSIESSEEDTKLHTIISMLSNQDPDRNFNVRKLKTKLLIHFDGGDFRIDKRNSDGTSLWYCTWLKLKNCPVVICLSADGKQVTMLDTKLRHNHSEEQKALFDLPCGKGSTFDKYFGVKRFYWLYSVQSEHRPTRAIIYQGYRYIFQSITKNYMSKWKCYICDELIRVEGCFTVILSKSNHTHEPLSPDEVSAITGSEEDDRDLLPDSSTFDPASQQGPFRRLAVSRLLSKIDEDRNFQVSIRNAQMKIFHNSYEYFYHSSTATHSLWKCVHSLIRQCQAILHVDHKGKQGFLPKHLNHNHSFKLWEIFRYPVGKSEIMDSSKKTIKPFWFLKPYNFLCSYPIVIYDKNKFNLTFITENGDNTKWRCSEHRCKAVIVVCGQFETIDFSQNSHNHEPQPDTTIEEWIRNYGVARSMELNEVHNESGNPTIFEDVPMDIEDTIKCEPL